MELRHLRYFTAVAEAGSLTAAATQLHISQPPLSVAIAKLEAEVGVQLLVRTPRGVELTSAGRFLLDAASRVLGDVDDIVAALGRFGAGLSGAITLAAVPALMWHRVPRVLRSLAADAPDVDIRLVDPPPWTAIDMLLQRSVDAAIVMVAEPDRFVERHSGTLDVIDWGDVPLVAALPPGASVRDRPLPLRFFDGVDLVVPRRTAAVPSLPEAIDAALLEHGVTPRSLRVTDTIQTSIPLIESGLAWGILPDADGRSLGRFNVDVHILTPQPRPLRALVLTRSGSVHNPALSRVLHHILAVSENGANVVSQESEIDRGR